MSTFIRLCLIVSSFVRTMQHSYIVKLSRFSWNLWRSINAFNLNIFLLQVLKTRNTDRLLRVAFTPFFSSNPLTCQNFGVIGGNSLLAVPGVWKCFLSNVPWNPNWMQDKRHKRKEKDAACMVILSGTLESLDTGRNTSAAQLRSLVSICYLSFIIYHLSVII